ncbi:MAG: lipid-A-disaccharide synthase [Acidobacteria bacterium]|nr:MAG: lipid-A-disaccharide synthase [Acidobacteriota bacterium]TDI40227.1 MAG: lipid-A-disaccharide synthase [Acidobacteriota bacterium]
MVFIVAGEYSGDNLGAVLMAAMKRLTGARVRFAGVGGPAMAREGLDSIFPMSDLAVMGLAEILPRARLLLRRLKMTVGAVRELQPDLVLTVDSPGFSLRLGERIRGLGIPRVHYVAPQLWAWNSRRGRKLTRQVDHLLALFPFEPEFFAQYGVPCRFVGHPIVEYGVDGGDGKVFRERHAIPADATVVAILPGSRESEVRRLLPVFGDVVARLAGKRPDLVAVVCAVDSQAGGIARGTANWPVPVIVVSETAEKYDAFAACAAAVTKSGTITLELALAGVPMVVAHKVSGLTALIARRLLHVSHVSMVNLLVGESLVPELLQEHCRARGIAAEIEKLLDEPAARKAQLSGFQRAVASLGGTTPPPSERAAQAVLALLPARD